MRILHVTEYCPGHSVGGTERYIQDLVEGQASLGIEGTVGWLNPEWDGGAELSESLGLPVIAFPGQPMRVDPPRVPLGNTFGRYIQEPARRPTLVHFHTAGRSEARLAELCRDADISYVFTYHSPAWLCRRETLLRWGRVVCDGEVRTLRCSACKAQERSAGPIPVAYGAALASALVGPLIPDQASQVARRVAFVRGSKRMRGAIRSFLSGAVTTIACSPWGVDVLRRNGAKRESVRTVPQGVSSSIAWSKGEVAPGGPFRVGYVGRVVEYKGVLLLLDACRILKDPDIRLRIVGMPPNVGETGLVREVEARAAEDSRIELVRRLPPGSFAQCYKDLHLLAVPSVGMETGPLCVFEAARSGVPVWGSERVGQRAFLEQVGRVVHPNSAEGWACALRSALSDFRRGRWQTLPESLPVRTMADVAHEMRQIYMSAAGVRCDGARSSLKTWSVDRGPGDRRKRCRGHAPKSTKIGLVVGRMRRLAPTR